MAQERRAVFFELGCGDVHEHNILHTQQGLFFGLGLAASIDTISLKVNVIRIRPTNRADIATWAEMRQNLWPSLSSSEALAEIEALIKDPAWASFIAEDTHLDALVGFMELSQRPFANGCDTSPVAFLEGIWVQEPYRHKGIGRRLVQAAETWARQRGLKELGSDADIANTLSHRAHEGWGFEETERVVYFRKRL